MDKAIEAAAQAFEQEYFGPHLHITARTSLAIGEAINAAIAAYEAAREAEGSVRVPVEVRQDAARYQWLRDGNAYAPEEYLVRGGPDLDNLCDTGIAARSKEEGGRVMAAGLP